MMFQLYKISEKESVFSAHLHPAVSQRFLRMCLIWKLHSRNVIGERRWQHNRCSDKHQNVSPCDTATQMPTDPYLKPQWTLRAFLSLRPADASMVQPICEVDSWTLYSKQWRYRSFWTSLKYSCTPADLKMEKLKFWVTAALTFVRRFIFKVIV